MFDLLNLYSSCFNNNVRELNKVQEILNLQDNVVFSKGEDSKIVCACVINKNTVLMLCTLKEYRNKGYASEILAKAEKYVLSCGYSEIKFCDGVDYIAPGIPINKQNESFFISRGYKHSWNDCECVDMDLYLDKFDYNEHNIGDKINGITYRWASSQDINAITECVDDAHSEFTKYYKSPNYYCNNSSDRVLIALDGDTVCSTLIVSFGGEVGTVGCTATRHFYRERGIATNIIKLGTKHLKNMGLKKAFLGYTYTDIIPMYNRSGYNVCTKYFMGIKSVI